MYAVSKTFTFDCAHMLPFHEGQCKNLHGHTYKLEVTVARDILNAGNNMIVDFAELKSIVQERIIDRFDHAFVYCQRNEFECEVAELLEKHNLKTLKLPSPTTVENMSAYIYNVLEIALEDKGVKLVKVQLWETPTSHAAYWR